MAAVALATHRGRPPPGAGVLGPVRVESFGPVRLVTLDRPDVRNAVDPETARALHGAFLGFEADSQSRVAVFHGAHGHFSAGWDLLFGARAGPRLGRAALLAQLGFGRARSLGPMGPTRLGLSKPVIAAVSGAAVGGGMELALWCDLRVMEEDACFGLYGRRFGFPLLDGGSVRLSRIVGLSRALDLILTGRRVDAAEALQMSLANRVVPRGTAREASLAIARRLVRLGQRRGRAHLAS